MSNDVQLTLKQNLGQSLRLGLPCHDLPLSSPPNTEIYVPPLLDRRDTRQKVFKSRRKMFFFPIVLCVRVWGREMGVEDVHICIHVWFESAKGQREEEIPRN